MTDESQDFSPLQYNLILRFLKPNGRLVSVGDSKQLIYGFIGSNLNSFNAMKERDNTTLLPLSVTLQVRPKYSEVGKRDIARNQKRKKTQRTE
jgi:superfamily I DNA/RNA helicase